MAKSVTVAALTHDLVRQQSFVTLVWDDAADKRVTLPVPFGCELDTLRAEAEKALRAMSQETATVEVRAAS